MPESPASEPYRAAIVHVLPDDLREELERVEEHFRRELAEALAAKSRATDFIRTIKERPFEHQEHELEQEHAALIAYHAGKLAKKVRWILEAWKDTPEE
ncbi:hypothetical protein [Zavarzinella formosa]|uniref:hypothetical protein n=1 Tax=Zavarzinella formosa TaxID=360055 RepID=UPI0003117178|nr:hypothetical protein [Zavarzinella formosa]